MVRVRFAPSPTGALHIGGVRTALYNYLFARQNGGKFLLRIEDTDSERFVAGAEEYIIESLKWCGIEIDEGVSVGGPHAPYSQSQRREIYWKYAQQLIDSGWAYYAFDTNEELDALRNKASENGETFAYNYAIRGGLKNSLTLPKETVEQHIADGERWVIRFKMPEDRLIVMNDIIRQRVEVNSSTLDDKVLFKSSDNLPTYHLANIVDDYLMQISHVIRGEEWLPSLPLHYMLYEALGWSDARPQFAHLPLILKPDGGGKLSKRDGDRLGFPVFPLEWKAPTGEVSKGYREDGYFPEAVINMLALLGWHPGAEQGDNEIFSMEQLIEYFSLERCSKSGARFDPEKARWFNAHYLRAKSDKELAELYRPILSNHGVESPAEFVEKVCSLIKERATFISDFWELSKFYFAAPTEYEQTMAKKFFTPENLDSIAKLIIILEGVEDFSATNTEPIVKQWIADNSLAMGKILNTLRGAIVGSSQGASIFEIMELIGKAETIARLKKAVATGGL